MKRSVCLSAGTLYLAGVLFLFLLIVLLAGHPIALQDYPDWVYQGLLFQHFITGHPIHGYLFHYYPVPNTLTTVGLGLLDMLIGWKAASTAWIALYFGLAVYSSHKLANALGTDSALPFLALPLVFAGDAFWLGFVDYDFGICLFLLWLSWLLRGKVNWLLQAGFLLLIFFFHLLNWGVAVLFLFCYCVQKKTWVPITATAPSALLGIWYALARMEHPISNAATGFPVGLSLTLNVLYRINALLRSVGCVNVLSSSGRSISLAVFNEPGVLLLIAGHVALAVLLVLLAATIIRQDWQARPDLRFVWMGVLALCCLYLVMPSTTFGLINPGYRFLQIAVALAFFLVLGRSGRLVRTVAALAVLSLVFNIIQFGAVQMFPNREGRLSRFIPNKVAQQLTFVHPFFRLDHYRAIEQQNLTLPIFETALFERRAQQTTPVKSDAAADSQQIPTLTPRK